MNDDEFEEIRKTEEWEKNSNINCHHNSHIYVVCHTCFEFIMEWMRVLWHI